MSCSRVARLFSNFVYICIPTAFKAHHHPKRVSYIQLFGLDLTQGNYLKFLKLSNIYPSEVAEVVSRTNKAVGQKGSL